MKINFHVFINNFVSAIEAKDIYTAGHSDRVADLSLLIAKSMGLEPKELDIIHIAGHLHDIGKIGIADGILLKSGKLTNTEFEVMKEHSKIGWEILKNNKELQNIPEIILHHHERFDGNGYPHKISGNNIPLGSRIIAIADSFDAMVTKRTYKDTMTFDHAVDELKKQSGKQFDPIIIEKFIDIIEQDNKVKNIINI
jgi:putative nucleotidyltransferase with HDIG domain